MDASETVAGDLIFSDGERVSFTVEGFNNYVEEHGLPVETIEVAPLSGIMRYMFHFDRIENADYGDIKPDTPMRVYVGGIAFMNPAIPYFSIFQDGESVATRRLYACDPEAVKGEAITAEKVKVSVAHTDEPATSGTPVYDLEGEEHSPEEYSLDFDNLYAFSNGEGRYLTFTDAAFALLAIQTGLGLAMEHERRTADRRTAKGAQYLYDKDVIVSTDQITRALFDPHSESYMAGMDYWSEEPKRIRSAKHGVIALQLKLPLTTDIHRPETYQLSARESFWLDAAYKLARDGRTTITGRDLLKKNGYSNPYRASEAMRSAADSMLMLTHTEIAVDTTDEYNKRPGARKVNRRVTFKPIVDGEFSLLEDSKGGDFEVELNGDPVEAMATLRYILDHRMFGVIPGHDDCLDGLRLDVDHRLMWRYVRRRVLEDGTNNRIIFDSMFETLNLDGADRHKKKRMIDQLEKMLRRACRKNHRKGKATVEHTQVFSSWKWVVGADGARRGVEIKPL